VNNHTDTARDTFAARCYELLEQIPAGKVTTYAEIARALGSKAYRAVGNAMAHNDKPIIRPCHRVVKSDGNIGGYALGSHRKETLLRREGVEIENGRVKHLSRYFHKLTL